MNESDIAAIPPTDEEMPVSPPLAIPPSASESTSAPPPAMRSQTHTFSEFTDQVEDLIRRHPIAAALATVGFGCAVGVAARSLLTPPPSPRHRVMELLEDIQDRLTDFAEPAYERAHELAGEGRDAVKHGLHSMSESKLGSRLRHLFS
ncbi:MAG: hypothetical protein ACO1TE_21930 [Prosthecobacter sp.]